MIEGSGSIPLTNGSGSGSRRPKNMWIRWIRIRNTRGRVFCCSWKCTRWWRSWGGWATPCDRRTCSRHTSALPRGWIRKSLCCGSGSALIWLSCICSRIGKAEHENWPKIKQKNLVSCFSKRLSYLRRHAFDILPALSTGRIQIPLPGSGSGLGSALR